MCTFHWHYISRGTVDGQNMTNYITTSSGPFNSKSCRFFLGSSHLLQEKDFLFAHWQKNNPKSKRWSPICIHLLHLVMNLPVAAASAFPKLWFDYIFIFWIALVKYHSERNLWADTFNNNFFRDLQVCCWISCGCSRAEDAGWEQTHKMWPATLIFVQRNGTT